MQKVSFCATFLVAVLLSPNADASYDAWWMLCNSCEQAMVFRTTAVNGTGGDGIVFVSNPDTLETRKFDRFSTYEDFGNGVVRMIHVSSATLSASEGEVLQGALENGNTVWVAMDRNDLNLPSASSSIDDLSNGMLYPALLSGLRQNLTQRNFFPSASSVGADLGVQLGPSRSEAPEGAAEFARTR